MQHVGTVLWAEATMCLGSQDAGEGARPGPAVLARTVGAVLRDQRGAQRA